MRSITVFEWGPVLASERFKVLFKFEEHIMFLPRSALYAASSFHRLFLSLLEKGCFRSISKDYRPRKHSLAVNV